MTAFLRIATRSSCSSVELIFLTVHFCCILQRFLCTIILSPSDLISLVKNLTVILIDSLEAVHSLYQSVVTIPPE